VEGYNTGEYLVRYQGAKPHIPVIHVSMCNQISVVGNTMNMMFNVQFLVD